MADQVKLSGLRWERSKSPVLSLEDLVSTCLVAELSYEQPRNKTKSKRRQKQPKFHEQELAEILSVEVLGPNELRIKVHLVDKNSREKIVTFQATARPEHPNRRSEDLANQAAVHLVKYDCGLTLTNRNDFLCRHVARAAIESHLRFQDILAEQGRAQS